MSRDSEVSIVQPGEPTEDDLAGSMGIELDADERARLQEALEGITELERLGETKAGLVQFH